ncbi:hypothetical protein B0O99DRAFT_687689 [Bisporella sp. PMI_857]|nr:hypothetical protein B0O99DRAFT_687689 [Bisporella sp. PMI_857]
MISSVQPSRPRLPPPTTNAPLNQQPFRLFTSTSTTNTSPHSHLSLSRPRTQIEAFPPDAHPVGPHWPCSYTQEARLAQLKKTFDTATRHPVFFVGDGRVKRVPAGVEAGDGAWKNPVARGYVFEERREGLERREGRL